jgi:hypothetical protein
MVTLFYDVIQTVHNGLIELDKKFIHIINLFESDQQFVYESYVEWENNGGKDLQIGANRLTNRQLFWMAFARTYYTKFHERGEISDDIEPLIRLQLSFFHVWVKTKPGFQDAFNCTMTQDEENLYEKFKEKATALYYDLKDKKKIK